MEDPSCIQQGICRIKWKLLKVNLSLSAIEVGKLVSMSLAATMASEKERTCFEKCQVIRTDGKIENNFFQVLKLVALLWAHKKLFKELQKQNSLKAVVFILSVACWVCSILRSFYTEFGRT